MSELRVYHVTEAYNDLNVRFVYNKDEVDKVIADLEDRLQAANEQIENQINSASRIMLFQDKINDNICKELHHANYKRCLAMAQMCMETHCETEADAAFFTRWEHRWLKFAEHYKEVI